MENGNSYMYHYSKNPENVSEQPPQVSQRLIADEIGDDYKTWVPGNIIFISGPTGCGKSTFILDKLLAWCIEQNKRILYLVNRKVLQRQLENRCKTEFLIQNNINYSCASVWPYISIETYQSIESKLKAPPLGLYQYYNYVVCDECHYFLSDSVFNPATMLSYQFAQNCLLHATLIFMSATMSNFKAFYKLPKLTLSAASNPPETPQMQGIKMHSPKFTGDYYLPPDYRYIRLHAIEAKMIPNVIRSQKGKFLIFVDSISYGKQLQKDICKSLDIEKNDIVFIDAEYEKRSAAFESVSELSNEQFISRKIVIATSVLDNGISIHDTNLRNIIILAPIKEQFIQMLGRKRIDSRTPPVNLYICKQSESYFKTKLNFITQVLSCASRFPPSACPSYILDCMLSHEEIYQRLKKCCYVCQNVVQISPLSMRQLALTASFYEEMAEAIHQDENAFLKKQAEWLGLGVDAIDFSLIPDKKEVQQNALASFLEVCNKYLDTPLSSIENKELKKELLPHLKQIISEENGFSKSQVSSITKGDRTLSYQLFNEIAERFNFPFRMQKTAGKYVINSKNIEETLTM